MTRYGYARVSTREQNPDSQWDALTAAGIDPGNIVIDKISGKLSSRPKLDQLLSRLQPGDQVVVTRLRRIGRNHQHLLDLSAWSRNTRWTSSCSSRASTRARRSAGCSSASWPRWPSSTGKPSSKAPWKGSLPPVPGAGSAGRRPKLTQLQLDQAQQMYDSGKHTVEEIAAAFHVRRSTLYRYLSAGQDGRDCVLVVYRNTRPGKIDPGTNRRYGETGQGESIQLEADRKWWPVAPVRERRLKGMVYVVDGTVARVRAVQPGGAWQRDDRGYADIPLTPPLTGRQIAEQFPALGLGLGDPRPHVRGKIREYLPL